MKEIVQALFLGIIQGLTEFLPVSSSGHMSIFRHFSGMATEGSGLFSAMLHIGTLVAIFIVFYKPIYELFMEFFKCFKDLFARKLDSFKLKNMSVTRRMLFMFVISCVPLLLLLLPVGNGNNLMDAVDVFSSDNSIKAEGLCFMITGFVLLLGSTVSQGTKRHKNVTPLTALIIGVAQFFAACFPGISRSGSTVSAAMCCKVSKNNAIRYSFILSIPAVLASGLVEFKDAMESAEIVPVFPLLVGVIASAVVGVLSIKLLQLILKKNLYKYFGIYCVILGFIVTIIGAVEVFIK
ncbi:MAG: undecaprenyl-diphosphate phosphatase [Clostridia bacterium]|nr:undecaprenyl-diphosphate phosphatase [Clostridia bacterium]